MNKLALSALMTCGLFQATGCIITTDDGFDSGSFSVTWGSDAECPAGAAAEIISLNVVTQEVFSDIYNCTDGSGTTAALPLGDYDVFIDVTDADGTTVFGQSFLQTASLNFDGDFVSVDLDIGSGAFGLTWSMVDGVGAPLTCGDVFAGGVDIIATLASTTHALVDIFDCNAGQGVSAPLYLGDYTLVVDVLDEADGALGTSVPRDESLVEDDELVDLGNFEFTFQ